MFQTRDMGWMRDWLAEEGYAPGEPDRIAMQWMNEPVPVAEMTGMQTPERLAELADARGTDADRLFFEIMTDHHLGGVHMADHAAANGARQEITDFAASVSRNQRIEVVEYEAPWSASASPEPQPHRTPTDEIPAQEAPHNLIAPPPMRFRREGCAPSSSRGMDGAGQRFLRGAQASARCLVPAPGKLIVASAFSPVPEMSMITPSPNAGCSTSSPIRSPRS